MSASAEERETSSAAACAAEGLRALRAVHASEDVTQWKLRLWQEDAADDSRTTRDFKSLQLAPIENSASGIGNAQAGFLRLYENRIRESASAVSADWFITLRRRGSTTHQIWAPGAAALERGGGGTVQSANQILDANGMFVLYFGSMDSVMPDRVLTKSYASVHREPQPQVALFDLEFLLPPLKVRALDRQFGGIPPKSDGLTAQVIDAETVFAECTLPRSGWTVRMNLAKSAGWLPTLVEASDQRGEPLYRTDVAWGVYRAGLRPLVTRTTVFDSDKRVRCVRWACTASFDPLPQDARLEIDAHDDCAVTLQKLIPETLHLAHFDSWPADVQPLFRRPDAVVVHSAPTSATGQHERRESASAGWARTAAGIALLLVGLAAFAYLRRKEKGNRP